MKLIPKPTSEGFWWERIYCYQNNIVQYVDWNIKQIIKSNGKLEIFIEDGYGTTMDIDEYLQDNLDNIKYKIKYITQFCGPIPEPVIENEQIADSL